jgi:hypothetical protein
MRVTSASETTHARSPRPTAMLIDSKNTAAPGNRPEAADRESHSFSSRHIYGLIRAHIWRASKDGAARGNRPEAAGQERRSFSFRHTYGLIPARIWGALEGGRYIMPVRAVVSLARVGQIATGRSVGGPQVGVGVHDLLESSIQRGEVSVAIAFGVVLSETRGHCSARSMRVSLIGCSAQSRAGPPGERERAPPRGGAFSLQNRL